MWEHICLTLFILLLIAFFTQGITIRHLSELSLLVYIEAPPLELGCLLGSNDLSILFQCHQLLKRNRLQLETCYLRSFVQQHLID